jgi:hypothetical protein
VSNRRSANLVLLLAVTLAACSGGDREAENSPAQTSGGTVSEAQIGTAADAGQTPIELVPTDAGLLRGCRQAAAILGFAVPCPTRLPPTSAPIRCEIPSDFSDAEVKPKEGCALGGGFILEPENPAVAHLVIEGSRDGFQSDCGERDPHRRVAVRGYEALLIDCPATAGLHAGHVLLRWVEQGTFVTVSSHGHTDVNRQVIRDIGAGIEIVRRDEVELVPAPDVLAAQCRRTAQRLSYAIPCPGLLPKGPRPTRVTDPALSKLPFADDYMRPGFRGYRRWAFLTVEFPSETREGHLVISASPRPVAPLRFMSLRPSPRDRLTFGGSVRLRNRKARVVRVLVSDGSIFNRHTVILWTAKGHTYGVGFHGLDREAQRLDLQIARSIRLVRTAGA